MQVISVTWLVVHPLMFASKFCNATLHEANQLAPHKRYDMSVICSVPHVRMWPYIASAPLASVAHARHAAWSSALLVKVYGASGP